MTKPTCIFSLLACLLAVLSGLSEAHGTKGGLQSFSHSYSSSSASAHSSSFSSSGSYSFGDKSTLPIIGPIPIAKSSATASASASASAAAVANAAGIAGVGAGISTGHEKNIGGSGYAGATSNTYGSHTKAIIGGSGETDEVTVLTKPPCCKKIPPGPNGSIHDYKVPSDVNTITGNSPGNSGYGQGQTGGYGGSKPSTQLPSSGYGQSHTNSGSSGATVIGAQTSSGYGQGLAGGHGGSIPSTQFPSSGYGQTNTNSGSSGATIIGAQTSSGYGQGLAGGHGGSKPSTQFPSSGYGQTQIGSGSSSGTTIIGEQPGNGQGQPGGYGGSKPSTQFPSAGYGQTQTNSGSSGATITGAQTGYGQGQPRGYGGSKPSTQFPSSGYGQTHANSGSSGATTTGAQISSGYGQVQSGGHGGSNPSAQIPSSGYGQTHTTSGSSGAIISGSQTSSGYGQTSTDFGNQGGVKQPSQGAGNGIPGKKPCCKGPFPGPNGSIHDSKPASAVGTAVNAPGSQESDKPSIPLHRPPVNFPGPSGSIYTSKPVKPIGTSGSYQPSLPAAQPSNNLPIPSNQGYTNKPSASFQPSGPAKVPSGSGVIGGYHSSGSLLPGPSGSIYTSKPVNPIGTSGSYQPSLPAVEPSNNLPVPSNQGYTNKPFTSYQPSGPANIPSGSGDIGGYHSSGSLLPGSPSSSVKPIKEYPSTGPAFIGTPSAPGAPINKPNGGQNGQYGYHSSSQAGASATANSHQSQYQGSLENKPSCTQGICTKEPPRTYLQPPQTQVKPVIEVDEKQSIPQVIPGYDAGSPQISTIPVAKPAFPSSSPGAAYNTEKLIPGTGGGVSKPGSYGSVEKDTGSSFNQPQGPGYVQPQQTQNKVVPIGVQNQGGVHQSSFSASSAAAGSSSYSASGGIVGYHKANDGSKQTDDEGKILYVSGPGSTPHSPGKPAVHIPSVTENTIVGGGLHEGPRGSPIIPISYPKKSDYDESKGDSTIVFVDGGLSSGSYSSGRGYSSSAGVAYSSTGSGGHAKGANKIYSSNIDSSYSKSPGGKPTGTYISTIYVDSNKPGSSDQGTIVTGSGTSGQGVVVIGTSGGNPKLTSGSFSGGSGGSYGASGSFGGSSVGHKGIPCTSNGCGTSYRQYSNAIPSTGTNNVAIHITSLPTGAGSSYVSSGSYGGGAHGSHGYGGVSSGNTGGGSSYVSSGSYGGGAHGTHGYGGVSSGKTGGGSSYVSSGSYGGGAHGTHGYGGVSSGKTGGGYGGSHVIAGGISGGSAVGSYGASSASSGHGVDNGGFLSSIFPDDGTAAKSGSYSKAGGYSSSSSFAKSSSFASSSSSSFAASSSGSYSSSHI